MSTFEDHLEKARSHGKSSGWEETIRGRRVCRRWTLFDVWLKLKLRKDKIILFQLYTMFKWVKAHLFQSYNLLTIMFSVMYKRDGAQWEYLYNLKVKTVIE